MDSKIIQRYKKIYENNGMPQSNGDKDAFRTIINLISETEGGSEDAAWEVLNRIYEIAQQQLVKG